MFKIGDIEINNRVVLAPMAGYTSFGYRKFYENFGPGLTYTEMISDMGLIYDNDETKEYLNFPLTNVPVCVQLFGSEPSNLAKAAGIVKKLRPETQIIDVNMACPVPKVTKNGAGSALLKDPKKCGEIIKAIKEETGLLVTAKIRLGWDKKTINFLDVVKELEKGGCDAIAIHCRTAKDLYLGQPDFDTIKDLKQEMKIPLIISGNIYSVDDAINALKITNADGVMIARGGIGNPYLLTQINYYFENGEYLPNPSKKEQVKYCLELAKCLIDEKGEEKAMRIYRSIAPKFLSGSINCKSYRNRLAMDLKTYKDLEFILNDFMYDN